MARWLLMLPVLLAVSAGLGALEDAFPGQVCPAFSPSAPAMNSPAAPAATDPGEPTPASSPTPSPAAAPPVVDEPTPV